jgi:FlaA1/EpsC-like NDP-sugar epimerase
VSTVDVPVDRRPWSAAATGAWLGRRLSVVAGAGLAAGDAVLVLLAFLLAYWVRFIAPDVEGIALGLDEYVRIGALVGIVTVVLFALHGFYDLDRPRSWLERFQMVLSTVSTALALTVTAAFFLGDHRFSRLWFTVGWALSVLGLIGWRTLAGLAYASVRAAVVPARKVLIVGANTVGRDLARDLAGSCDVIGFVDNGSDLEEPISVVLRFVFV